MSTIALKDEEEEEWSHAGIKYFNQAYEAGEPDYADVAVKEPNPAYKA